jgi:hypothetical protein
VSRHAQTTTRYFDKALAFAVPKQGSKVVVELATADQVLEGRCHAGGSLLDVRGRFSRGYEENQLRRISVPA